MIVIRLEKSGTNSLWRGIFVPGSILGEDVRIVHQHVKDDRPLAMTNSMLSLFEGFHKCKATRLRRYITGNRYDGGMQCGGMRQGIDASACDIHTLCARQCETMSYRRSDTGARTGHQRYATIEGEQGLHIDTEERHGVQVDVGIGCISEQRP